MADIKNGQSVSIEIKNPLVYGIGITVTAGKIELELTGSGQAPQSLSPNEHNEAHQIPRPSNASAIKLTGRGNINTYLEPLAYYTENKTPTGQDR